MLAPHVKCRRPTQNVGVLNVGALGKMSGALKCRRLSENVGALKYSKSKKQLRLTQIILSPRSNCICTKYS